MAAPLFITPSRASTSPGGTVTFQAMGGSGSGYVWALDSADSGGSIAPLTGVYTAGPRTGYPDVVQLTDGDGSVITVEVQVLAGPTLADLREQARQRSDMVNSQFISDQEWATNINSSYKELYDLLIMKYGENYEVQIPFSIQTDGVSETYPLPPDFYKLLGVDFQINNSPNGYISLKAFNFAERNRYAVPNLQAFYGFLTNLRYRVIGNKIRFTPQAAAGQNLRLWYVPKPSALANDAAVLDGISGWEEFVVVDAAIKALAKEESDPQVLILQKIALTKRIEDAAANRDLAYPQTVSDVTGNDIPWGSGSGSGYGGGY